MDLPIGFDDARINGKVCKLKKSLYGVKRHKGDKPMILIIHVDIILTTDDIVEMERLKKSLAAEFEIKDLSPLRYFLGMEVARNRSDISISQRKYILDLLEEIGMLRCKLADTPINHNLKLGKQSEISVVSQYMHSPYEEHMEGNLVTWRSKKQIVVARSSAEIEFKTLAHGICKLLWLKILLDDLKFMRNEPMKIYSDNKVAITISHNHVHHNRTKHVEVGRHFIKERIEEGSICVVYIPSSQYVADLLTKGSFKPVFKIG
ncbi:Retrovirus-related Pol polyprotein from transposon RE1 [Vitis vinifera]|uniref:Retrovirus-related Pol polyprotein from transposon RE1 n=1 Tax=Vitis vinifera TaxID=29760 RepID=A0A438BRL5_VITVI|nr:Retrovirus-related Pol polyprotein from transposon RE1 [Vitis vinifera]